MDDKINALNVEIGVFLQNLRRFVAGQQKISIGNKTAGLLGETVIFLEELITKAKFIDVPNETNPNFLQDLDPVHFELQRSVMCLLCNTSMPVTREDVHGHVREDTHLDRLPRLPLGPRSFPKQKLLKEKFSSPAANSSSMQKTSLVMLSSNDQDILSKGPRSLKTNSDDASKIGLKRTKNSNAMQPNRIESGGKGVELSMPSTRENVGYLHEDSHLGRLTRIPQPLSPPKVDGKFSSPSATSISMGKKFSVPSNGVNDNIRKDKLSDGSSLFGLNASKSSKSMLPHKIESGGIENFVGASWANVKEASDSDNSWEAPIRGFNYDSKYLIQLRNLPWTATKPEIVEFLDNITIMNDIDGINFIINDKITKNIEAYVQLESLRDYTAALKLSGTSMGGQCIEVLPAEDQYHFNLLVQKRQIPSKERVVFVENVPSNYTEQDIRTFFSGLLIHSVRMTHDGTSAYVKFTTIDDVEFAIKKNNKESAICIYRSTAHLMQNDGSKGNGHSKSPMPSVASLRRDSTKNSTKTDGNQLSVGFLKVRGLPLAINEPYVFDIFIGLRLNGVQMERNERGLFNGTAIVEFENVQDYEMGWKLDLSPLHPGIYLARATKADFMLAKEVNDKLRLNA